MKTSVNRPIIYTIGSGKGGVGKSFFSCNLAINISKSGKRVLLVDADLGAANLHTLMGIESKSRFSFSSFLNGKLSSIKPLISKTDFTNLFLISGAADAQNVVNIDKNKLDRLYQALIKLRCDYIILDIGPGTSPTTLNLFLMADEGILIGYPEPTSMENIYRFLKCLFLYQIKSFLASSHEEVGLKGLIQRLFSAENAKLRTMKDVFSSLKKMDGRHGETLKSVMGKTRISIIFNQTRKPEDEEVGFLVQKICYDYFGYEIGYLGHIPYDDCVRESICKRQPLISGYSQSEPAKAINNITHQLLSNEKEDIQDNLIILPKRA